MPIITSTAQGVVLRIEDSGELTIPKQTSFLAYLPSNVTNATGAGASFQLGSGTALTEVFDRNDDFNTNGTFTAPVDGLYMLSMNVTLSNIALLMTSLYSQITTTAASYRGNYFNPYNLLAAGTAVTATMSVLAPMSASDTATFSVTISNGLSNAASISGGSSPYVSYVYGYLVA